MSHEARTPLNAIKGYAELLLAGAAGPLSAEARGHVAEIARAAGDLEAALVEAAATLAEGAAGRGPGPGASSDGAGRDGEPLEAGGLAWCAPPGRDRCDRP